MVSTTNKLETTTKVHHQEESMKNTTKKKQFLKKYYTPKHQQIQEELGKACACNVYHKIFQFSKREMMVK